MDKAIAERIQEIIQHYELTISAFADEIGVQRSSISHILSGRNKPSLDFIIKLVQSYPEVNLYWLLNGKGNFPETKSPTTLLDENAPEEKKAENFSKALVTSKTSAKEPVKVILFYEDGTFEHFDTKKQ